jgi:hypothetical protein
MADRSCIDNPNAKMAKMRGKIRYNIHGSLKPVTFLIVSSRLRGEWAYQPFMVRCKDTEFSGKPKHEETSGSKHTARDALPDVLQVSVERVSV